MSVLGTEQARAWNSTRRLCRRPRAAPGEARLGCYGDVQQQLGSVHQTLHQGLRFAQQVGGLLSKRIHFLEELLPRERDWGGFSHSPARPTQPSGTRTGRRQSASQ